MSTEDLWAVIGRSRVDLSFGGQLHSDFERAIKEAGYDLTPEEIRMAKEAISAVPTMPSTPDLIQFQQEKMKERLSSQVKRINELGEYTVQILKETLNNAAKAYVTITRMNYVMFFTGIGLFIFAALYGAYFQEIIYSLVFGGLGAASFIALFLVGPIEKTQIALSNLVQVEVAFMNFFEQISFWENFALTPTGNPPAPNPANLEKASQALQDRTKETIALLQKYVENISRRKTR